MRLDVLGRFDSTGIDVALKISGTSITVRHHDSMAYGGILRQNLAKSLIDITYRYQVTLVAFILVPAKRKNVPQAGRSCQLCITVYGTQEASKNVGEVLDHAGIYLQHPTSYDPTMPCINPHYLVRPGGAPPVLTVEKQAALPIRPSIDLSTDQRLKGDVLQMINSSAHGPSNYSDVTPSSQMRTTLKP